MPTPRTVVVVSQLADGCLRTSTTTADTPLFPEGDTERFVASLRRHYADFGAELISITQVEESHSDWVESWHHQRGLTMVGRAALWTGNMCSAAWWKQHAMAMLTVMVLLDFVTTGLMAFDYRLIKDNYQAIERIENRLGVSHDGVVANLER